MAAIDRTGYWERRGTTKAKLKAKTKPKKKAAAEDEEDDEVLDPQAYNFASPSCWNGVGFAQKPC